MRSRYKIYNPGSFYFITCTTVGWLPIFTSAHYFDILISCLKHHQEKSNLKVYAYVIMENHIHLILQSENLDKVLHSFKTYTAKEILDSLKQDNRFDLLDELAFRKLKHKTDATFQVWQEGFHPQELTTQEMLSQKIEYIHNNPVKRGYIEMPEHWRYSSARNYIKEDHSILHIETV